MKTIFKYIFSIALGAGMFYFLRFGYILRPTWMPVPFSEKR